MTTNSNLSDSDGSGGDSSDRDETFVPPGGHPSEDGSSTIGRNDENQIAPHRTSRQAARDRSSKVAAAAVVQRGNVSNIVAGRIGTQQHQRSQEIGSQQSALATAAAAAAAAPPPPPRTKRRRRKIQRNPQQQQQQQQEQHNHQHQDVHPRPKKKKQTQTLTSSSSLSFTSGSFLTCDDDDEFAFHEDNTTTSTAAARKSLHQRRKRCHSEPQFRSLPILIEERRLGGHIGRSTIGKNTNSTMMMTTTAAAATAKRISRSSSSAPKLFQFETLKTFTSVPSKPTLARRQWRPYVVNTNFSTSLSSSRSDNNNNHKAFSSSKIPFTQLGTPPEDAVLALHRDGNYTLSIGPYDMTATTSHGLAVRFHSLPTPHQRLMKHMSSMTNKRKSNRQMNQTELQQQQQEQQQQQQQQEHPSIFGVSDIQVHHTKEDAPLLQTIPLLEGIGTLRTNHGIDQVMADESNAVDNGAGAGAGTGAGVGVNFADFGAEAESAIFNFQRAVSPANTPVEFLISHDWSIGICRLRPSSTSQWQDIHGVTSRRGDANNDNGSFNNETSHVEDDQQLRHREDVDAERDQPELVPVGSLVLFTLPHGRRNLQKPRTGSGIEEEDESTTENLESAGPSEEIISNTNQIYYRCQNVQVVSNAGMTTRNLLWNVDSIPTQVSQSVSYDTASAPFASYVEAPGYLFLNDEADGFRLTWIATSNRWYLDKAKCHSIKEEEVGVTPNSDASTVPVPSAADGEREGRSERNGRTDIVTIESSWEDNSVTSVSGQPIYRSSYCPTATHDTPKFCASIVSEAYLHIDRVLALVLQSRKGMLRPPGQRHRPILPEFCYNLISTKNNGRTAQLLIAFLRPKGGYALGIFVDVDLFSGTYREKNWVQDRLVRDAASMHFWCTKLTLNSRMKEVRAGPYALSARENNYKDWTRLCREVGNINPDCDDDFDPKFWDRQQATSRVISVASLYPCCDVVTNQALIDCCPVPSIRAKHSPIQLVYG